MSRIQGFHDQFRKRFLLRTHMFWILCGTFSAGLVINRGPFLAGVKQMLCRYPLAIGSAYAVFIGLIRLWLSYVASIGDSGSLRSEEGSGSQKRGRGFAYDGSGLTELADVSREAEGCALILLVLLAVFMLGGALLLIYEAPVILTDAAFQFLLAGSLIRGSRKIDKPDWAGSIIGATWKPFAGTLLLAMLFAAIAFFANPGAHTLREFLGFAGNGTLGIE